MVSRETTPAPPAVAAQVFGDALPTARRYAGLLATVGVERGLIGPRETPRLWSRHLLNCAVVAPELGAHGTVADVGSGAGLPGVVLAILRPDLELTLVEPLLRRSTFLGEVAADLGLSNVEVIRLRAEELHGRRSFDAVVSRAVAPLDRLARWCLPLLLQGGLMVAMKGSSVGAELEAARPTLTALGAVSPQVRQLGTGVVDPPTTVLRVVRERPSRLGLSRQQGAGRDRGRRARRGVS